MANAVKAKVKKVGKCEITYFDGCTGKGKRRIDPYTEEICGRTEWALICDSCYGSLCDEI